MKTTDADLSAADLRKIRTAKIFTTGLAAKVCRVAPRTISKWIDDKDGTGNYFRPGETYHLPSTKVGGPAHGPDRRIRRAGLIRFLMDKGMADCLARLQPPKPTILYVGQDAGACGRALPAHYELVVADCPFAAGMAIRHHSPLLVIVDFALPGGVPDPRALCMSIRAIARGERPALFGLRTRTTDDNACVDDFTIHMDGLLAKVAKLVPVPGGMRIAS